MDFNFAHFANFNFTHFEIEESFGLICVTKWSISLCKFPFQVFKRCSLQVWAAFLLKLYIKEFSANLGKTAE